jgi:hypothetical protein
LDHLLISDDDWSTFREVLLFESQIPGHLILFANYSASKSNVECNKSRKLQDVAAVEPPVLVEQ